MERRTLLDPLRAATVLSLGEEKSGLFDDLPGGWTLVELVGLDGGLFGRSFVESFVDLGLRLTVVADFSDS